MTQNYSFSTAYKNKEAFFTISGPGVSVFDYDFETIEDVNEIILQLEAVYKAGKLRMGQEILNILKDDPLPFEKRFRAMKRNNVFFFAGPGLNCYSNFAKKLVAQEKIQKITDMFYRAYKAGKYDKTEELKKALQINTAVSCCCFGDDN